MTPEKPNPVKPHALCSACAMKMDHLRREVRLNEKRARVGKPPLMDRIRRIKADMATCAAMGHHEHPERAVPA